MDEKQRPFPEWASLPRQTTTHCQKRQQTLLNSNQPSPGEDFSKRFVQQGKTHRCLRAFANLFKNQPRSCTEAWRYVKLCNLAKSKCSWTCKSQSCVKRLPCLSKKIRSLVKKTFNHLEMVKNLCPFWDLRWTVPKLGTIWSRRTWSFWDFFSEKCYNSVTFWTVKPGWKIVLTMTKDFPTFLTRNSLYFEDSPLICWEVSLFSSFLLSEPTHRHSKLQQTLLKHFLNGRNIADSVDSRESWRFSDAERRIVGFLRPQMIFLHITYLEKSVNCLDIVSYFGKMVEV